MEIYLRFVHYTMTKMVTTIRFGYDLRQLEEERIGGELPPQAPRPAALFTNFGYDNKIWRLALG